MDQSAVLYTAVGRLVTICEKLYDCNAVQLNAGEVDSNAARYNIRVTGQLNYSNALVKLDDLFSDSKPITSWFIATLSDGSPSKPFLGAHVINVECHVFSPSVIWTTRSGAKRKVKCVIRCNTRLISKWKFVEFEDLFGGKSSTDVENKMVVFYEGGFTITGPQM